MQLYFRTFRRFRWLFALPLLAVPLLLALTIKPPPSFKVKAALWVEQPLYVQIIKTQNGNSFQTPADNLGTLLEEQLSTRTFQDQILSEVGRELATTFTKEAGDTLKDKIYKDFTVSPSPNHLIEVSYSDSDSRRALAISKAVVHQFYSMVITRVQTEGEAALNLFQAQVDDAKASLTKVKSDLNQFKGQHPDVASVTRVDPSYISGSSGGLEYSSLLQSLDNAQTQYDQLNVQLESIKKSYGAFLSGQDSIIKIRDEPFIASSLTFDSTARLILGAVLGLGCWLILTVLVVLIVIWSDKSVSTVSAGSNLLNNTRVWGLPYSKSLRNLVDSHRSVQDKGAFSTDENQIRKNPVESLLFHKKNLRRIFIVGVLYIAALVGFTLLLGVNPLLGSVILVISLLVGIIGSWPVFGYFSAIFLVLFCEIFSTPDGISPFTRLVLSNLNSFTDLPLSATPLEVLLVLTSAAAFLQAVLTRKPFFERSLTAFLMYLFTGFLLFAYIWGVFIRKGDPKAAEWEIRALFYIIVLYFLTVYFMRKRLSWKIYSLIFPIGLLIMGGITTVRFFAFKDLTNQPIFSESPNGFNHETAVLFVLLISWSLSKILFGGSLLEKVFGFIVMPPAFFWIVVSNRRAAFAVLAACGLIILIAMFVRQRKLFVVALIIIILTLPPFLIVFRNSAGPLGAAARAFSAVSNNPGTRDYNSDLYRLVEKTNVQLTIKRSPVLGIGFGEPFDRYVYYINLEGFTFQYYTAHVQVLWLWLKVGMGGWATFWFILCLALFKLGQLVKYEKNRLTFNLCILAGCTITAIMVYSYLDLGLINVRLMVLLGTALGIIQAGYNALPKRADKAAKRFIENPEAGKVVALSN